MRSSIWWKRSRTSGASKPPPRIEDDPSAPLGASVVVLVTPSSLADYADSLAETIGAAPGSTSGPDDPTTAGDRPGDTRTAPLPASAERAGARIDRYRLLQPLGEGGCVAQQDGQQKQQRRRHQQAGAGDAGRVPARLRLSH